MDMPPGHLDELDTPCLTVDLDVFESNVRTCFRRLAGVDVRPHLKTAKSPEVARLLLDAGAVGVCVAKLSEAEVMLIDVNVGQNRCGVAPEDALALADRIGGLERLRLVGLQGYEGNLQHLRDPEERRRPCDVSMGRLAQAAEQLRAAGHTRRSTSTT